MAGVISRLRVAPGRAHAGVEGLCPGEGLDAHVAVGRSRGGVDGVAPEGKGAVVVGQRLGSGGVGVCARDEDVESRVRGAFVLAEVEGLARRKRGRVKGAFDDDLRSDRACRAGVDDVFVVAFEVCSRKERGSVWVQELGKS
jgi:hypothetical protein